MIKKNKHQKLIRNISSISKYYDFKLCLIHKKFNYFENSIFQNYENRDYEFILMLINWKIHIICVTTKAHKQHHLPIE